jgi:RecB family exonuclease
VEIVETALPSPASGDLGKVQRVLAGGTPESLTGDGSLIIVRATTEMMAADAMASWIAAGGAEEHVATVCVLGSGTGLLDAAMARHGLPRFGILPASSARAVYQVLLLAFATRWKPFDPFRLMDLLVLDSGPVPRWAARHLARALQEEPGRGGEAWAAAMRRCVERQRSYLIADGVAPERIEDALQDRLDRWRPWVEPVLYDETAGMPLGDAIGNCMMVAGWAAKKQADPLRKAVTVAASALAEALRESGEMVFPRHLLARMVAAAVEFGIVGPDAAPEAAPWSAISDAAAMWGAAEDVVWWAPTDEESFRHFPWTQNEVAELAIAGVRLDTPAETMAARALGWHRPLLHARRRAVLFFIGGRTADAGAHPILHELAPLLEKPPEGIVVPAERLLAGSLNVAGRHLVRVPASQIAAPVKRRTWTFTPGAVAAITEISPTEMETLLGCRLAWALKHAAGLRRRAHAEIRTGETLLGNLAHAVFREVFQPGEPPGPLRAQAQARRLLDTLVPRIAGPLLLPGNANDLARAYQYIPQAASALAERLGRVGAAIEGTEISGTVVSPALGGITLRGRADMLLVLSNSVRISLDSKWTGSPRYRIEELREGRAVQLAAYVEMFGNAHPEATAAFFLLRQARILAATPQPWPLDYVAGPGLANAWGAGGAGVMAAVARIASGRADAAEIPPADGETIEPIGTLNIGAPCRFCEFGNLCGHEGLS